MTDVKKSIDLSKDEQKVKIQCYIPKMLDSIKLIVNKDEETLSFSNQTKIKEVEDGGISYDLVSRRDLLPSPRINYL